MVIPANSFGNKYDFEIICAMDFVKGPDGFNYCDNLDDLLWKVPCGYYLYPRSSMGSKTPLRLSNSVGIIDSGYRGNICALFDNPSNEDYTIQKGDRLVQICCPNLSYSLEVITISDISELGHTERGNNGFGSTGRC